jgi:hypothetical protein
MRRTAHTAVAGLVTVLIGVAVAAPAMATDFEGGNQNCTSVHGRVVTRGDSTAGAQEHIQNGLSFVFPVKNYRHTDYSNRNQVSAGWYIGASGSLYHNTTYAYCLY